MGRGNCKHVSCLSITKLADRLERDGISFQPGDTTDGIWVCAVCLHAFPSSQAALFHARKHNHQIFYCCLHDTTAGFFCAICAKDLEVEAMSPKHRDLVRDAAQMISEALKKPSVAKQIISNNVDSSLEEPSSSDELRPSGLVNLGNTCFMNSALQALAAVTVALSGSTDASIPDGLGQIGVSLLGTLQSIPTTGPVQAAKAAGKGKGSKYGNIVDPSPFLGAISKRYKEFRRLRQQDAHDFIRLLFNALDDEHSAKSPDKKKLPAPSLHQLMFGGKSLSRVICDACKKATEVQEAFMDLSLAIPPLDGEGVEGLLRQMRSMSTDDILSPLGSDDVGLVDLLRFWAKPTKLANENAFACENCPTADDDGSAKFVYRPATLQYSLQSLPPCLIIHLQRFSVSSIGRRGIRLAKDHTHIHIPAHLDLSPFTKDDGSSDGAYELTAMIVHEGASADAGHYVAIVRYGEGWWHVSDTSVKRLASNIASYNPYLVLYTKSTRAKS